jgi:hypothetical protein
MDGTISTRTMREAIASPVALVHVPTSKFYKCLISIYGTTSTSFYLEVLQVLNFDLWYYLYGDDVRSDRFPSSLGTHSYLEVLEVLNFDGWYNLYADDVRSDRFACSLGIRSYEVLQVLNFDGWNNLYADDVRSDRFSRSLGSRSYLEVLQVPNFDLW